MNSIAFAATFEYIDIIIDIECYAAPELEDSGTPF